METTELDKIMHKHFQLAEKHKWEEILRMDDDCNIFLSDEIDCAVYAGQIGFKSIADFNARSNYSFDDLLDGIGGWTMYIGGRLYTHIYK